MNLTIEQKLAKFTDIMRSIGYENINFFALKSAIETPEIKDFFDWFCTNINESWLLTSEQIENFKQKQSNGHVIWDLNKLIEMENLANDSEEQTGDLEKENELIEKEIKILNEQLQKQRSQKEVLNDKLDLLKTEQICIDSIADNIKKKSGLKENSLVTLSQNIESSITCFQDKIGIEDRYCEAINNSLNKIDKNFNQYYKNEQEIMCKIKDKMFLKFDYDFLDKSIKLNEANEIKNNFVNQYNEFDFLQSNTNSAIETDSDDIGKEYKNVEKYLKLIAKYYPSIIHEWFTAKLKYEIEKCNYNEMNRIIENKDEFFEYNQQQLEKNPKSRINIEQSIRQNIEKQSDLIQKIQQINSKVAKTLESFSKLKVTQIIEKDMKKKQIELNLFSNKQDKLLNYLNSQKKRIKLINNLQANKLDEMSSIKTLFVDLNKKRFSFTSPNWVNPTVSNNISIMQTNNMSFSVSMANLLSTTSMPLTPSKFKQDQNSTMIGRTMTQSVSYNGNLSLINPSNGNIFTNQTVQLNCQTESPFMHLVNQFLIAVLTGLKSDKLSQKYIKLQKPVSVNFSDNIDNFLYVYESTNLNYSKNHGSNRKTLFDLLNSIEDSIEYMYERNDTSTNKLKYNLSRIKITGTRILEEKFDIVERKLKLVEEHFARQIFSKIKKYNEKLKSNELEKLKRDFFTVFYNKSFLIENVIESLNSIDSY